MILPELFPFIHLFLSNKLIEQIQPRETITRLFFSFIRLCPPHRLESYEDRCVFDFELLQHYMQTVLPRRAPEPRQIFCTEHKS